MSNTSNINAIVLWDSSHRRSLKSIAAKEFKYDKKIRAHVVSWGIEFILGKNMVKEIANFPRPKDLMKDINTPIKIIVAGKGILTEGGKEYFKYAKQPKSFSVIKGASHCFDEEGTESMLFKETLNWVKKF